MLAYNLCTTYEKKKPCWFFFFLNEILWVNEMKLASNDNWGIEFKFFISNWKRFDLYFPPAKAKKPRSFLLPFYQSKWKYESIKPNLSQKAMKFTEELFGKLFISNWKRFDCYFPMLKPKNWARFLLLLMKVSIKSQSKDHKAKFQW